MKPVLPSVMISGTEHARQATQGGAQASARLLRLAEERDSGQISRIARFLAATYNGQSFQLACSSCAPPMSRSATTCSAAWMLCAGGAPTCSHCGSLRAGACRDRSVGAALARSTPEGRAACRARERSRAGRLSPARNTSTTQLDPQVAAQMRYTSCMKTATILQNIVEPLPVDVAVAA